MSGEKSRNKQRQLIKNISKLYILNIGALYRNLKSLIYGYVSFLFPVSQPLCLHFSILFSVFFLLLQKTSDGDKKYSRKNYLGKL